MTASLHDCAVRIPLQLRLFCRQVVRNLRGGASGATPYDRISAVLRGRTTASAASTSISSASLPAYVDVRGNDVMPSYSDLHPEAGIARNACNARNKGKLTRGSLFVEDEARDEDGDDEDDDDDEDEEDANDSFLDDRDEEDLSVGEDDGI